MAFSHDFIDELHERCDIVETINASVPLKRAGRTYKGLCPFHNEKTPSFVVYPETRSFYCFGCQKGGDVVSFIMEQEHLSYVEAIKELAGRAGIQVPNDVDDKTSRLKTEILAANREAARFFHKQLNSEYGKNARLYLRKRALSDGTIVRFGIGYAPDSWNALLTHMRSAGFSEETLIAGGLCAKGKNGCYDIFRNRVMFPIIDVRGNVVAFGGRRLNEEDRAKYVNTQDTPVYKKSHNLFALNIAKTNQDRRIIIAEGYLDVISLHQAGFTCTVAALGTALTPEQAHMIRQYADEVVLCYDSDEAGQKATKRSIEILKPTGILIKVVTVENAKDPDDFIKQFGAESFARLLDDSGTAVEYQLKKVAANLDVRTPAGKVEYLKAASEILARISSRPEIEVYAGNVAEVLSITPQSVLLQIEELQKKRRSREERIGQTQLTKNIADAFKNFKGDKKRETTSSFYTEQRLFAVLCANPDFVGDVADILAADDFLSEDMAAVFAAIAAKHRINEFKGYASLGGEISEYMYSQLAMWIASAGGVNYSRQDAVYLAEKIKKQKSRPTENDVNSMSPEELMNLLKKDKRENNG